MKENESKVISKRPKFLLKCFVVAACVCLFNYLLVNNYFAFVLDVIKPITIAFVVAYLLNPIVKFVDKHLNKLLKKFIKKEKLLFGLSRGISIFVAFVFGFGIVAMICYLIIPSLITSLVGLVNSLPSKIDSVISWYNSAMDEHGIIESIGKGVLGAAKNWVQSANWLSTITQISNGVMVALNVTLDVLVGVLTAIYVLASKEVLCAQIKKLMYAFFERNKVNTALITTREAHRIMSGFIIGKIIDSAIIGVLCFVVMWIFKIPYPLLVSVIVGVTNVIPYFGPFIGAIPSAALILLIDPIKGLLFIVIILVIQQLDGNFIGPAILGDTTGLSAFWVIVAILVGGGLFGFIGMVVGVPVLATIFFVLARIVNKKLVEKGIPTNTDYYNSNQMEVDTDEQ